MKLNERLLLLLACLLLFTQQQAMLHALSHVGEATAAAADAQQPDEAPAHALACDKCVAYAQLAGGLPSATHELIPRETAEVFAVSTLHAAAQRPTLYHSRAPPVLV